MMTSMIQLQSQPIAIFGEVLVDVFPDQTKIGGAPYNIACHLKALGLSPLLMTRIGDDAMGDQVLQAMARNQLSVAGVQHDAHYPTGQVMVTFNEHGHHFEILAEQAYDAIALAPVQALVRQHRPVMAYIGSLALRDPVSRSVAEQWLAQADYPVFCDINLRAPWYSEESLVVALRYAHIAKISHEELAEIARLFKLRGTPQQQAIALKQHFNLEHVVITCGAQGSWWVDPALQITHADPVTLDAPFIDSVGAGDAYSAVCIIGLLLHWPIHHILSRASQFASTICTIRGAVPDASDVYQSFLNAW